MNLTQDGITRDISVFYLVICRFIRNTAIFDFPYLKQDLIYWFCNIFKKLYNKVGRFISP